MNERIVNPISDQELERRWSAVRAGMRERGIDALIMQNTNDWLGGYVNGSRTYRLITAIREA